MSGNVIELRPGIRQLANDREDLGVHIPPMDLSDPRQEADVLSECRRYSIAVFAKCFQGMSDDELNKAIRISSSVSTILQSLAHGRMARRAASIARSVDEACKAALEAAETL